MTWQPRIEPRERILACGVQGTGKSTAWLTIARKLPESTFYVLDTDYSVDRLLATEFEDVHNVVVYAVDEWEDAVKAFGDAKAKAGRDDWLIIDMIGPLWDQVQEFYSHKVFGKDVDVFFLEARMSQKKGNAFDGRRDWGVINSLYRANVAGNLLKFPGHVFITSSVKVLGEDADKAVKSLFGPYGIQPAAQKHTGHLVQTVLLFTKRRVGEYFMTSCKDRGREEMENEPMGDFFNSYMRKRAGWHPVVVKAE